MRYPCFEIRLSKDGQYYYVLRSAYNGEPLLTGEMHPYKQGCQRSIDSVKKNCTNDNRYAKDISTNLKYYFVLKAENGEPLGISELYASSFNRDNGISAVKRDAPLAIVYDTTT